MTEGSKERVILRDCRVATLLAMTQIPLALQAFPLSQGGLQPLPPLSKGGAATAAVGFSENPPTGEPESREGTQESYNHHKSYSKSVLSNPHSTPSTLVK